MTDEARGDGGQQTVRIDDGDFKRFKRLLTTKLLQLLGGLAVSLVLGIFAWYVSYRELSVTVEHHGDKITKIERDVGELIRELLGRR